MDDPPLRQNDRQGIELDTMGIFKRIFSSDSKDASGQEAVESTESADAPPIEEEISVAVVVDLSDEEKAALIRLGGYAGGTSLETFGETTGLEKMVALYRLDKLVRLGLVKRSRPMFREPEVYELTENGRETLVEASNAS
jgi:hypothetical protein